MADTKQTILIQLDTDPQPSVFDSVVAVDSGVAHLFRHGEVTPETVAGLVHGALFTRGFSDLARTAIFVGGSNVAAAETLFEAVKSTFFGPFRVSTLFDANGANTTAAAAVLSAIKGMGGEGSLTGVSAAVLAATGPVGERVARLLRGLGASVAVGSRDLGKAEKLADRLKAATDHDFRPFRTSDPNELRTSLDGVSLLVSAGAAGACLLPASVRESLGDLRVVIDLNAVPPLGIEGIEATDKDKAHGAIRAWGALGVGGLKMKIHKRAIQALFETNDKVLDAEQVLEIGRTIS